MLSRSHCEYISLHFMLRPLAATETRNEAGTSDGCDLRIVDLIDDFPRKVLAATIGEVSRNQEAMLAARRKSDEPWSHFERCHLRGRYLAERRALLCPCENRAVIL